MELDVLLLSRIQFALTVGFHFIFPPISIGLAWILVIIEWKGWRSSSEVYQAAGRFFAKFLALSFALGVASGIVMEFQFGTNWAEYSKFVGDIFGAPLAAEAIFAFFLESTFLGLYLFGRNKVSKAVHWFSIFMVAVGATISAFWILVANSWMQTPAGFEIRNGRAELTSFMEAVFNPSMLPRFNHTMTSCFIAGAFLVIGVSAYLLVRNRKNPVAIKTMRLGLIVGFIASLWAAFPSGHYHAEQVAQTQPEKFATMEGLADGQTNAPLTVFAIPDGETRKIKFAIEIPGALSILAHGNPDAFVDGMNDLEAKGMPLPPFEITFISFHSMVMLGTLFIALTAIGLLFNYIKKLNDSKWYGIYIKVFPFIAWLPILAIQLGWILAEVGRQPWIVYQVMKTRDAFSTNVSGAEILISIIIFSLIYILLGSVFLVVLGKLSKDGPEVIAVEEV